jgi:hypothetical protein
MRLLRPTEGRRERSPIRTNGKERSVKSAQFIGDIEVEGTVYLRYWLTVLHNVNPEERLNSCYCQNIQTYISAIFRIGHEYSISRNKLVAQ